MTESLNSRLDAKRQELLGNVLQSRLDAKRKELAGTSADAFGDSVGRSLLNNFLQMPKLLATGAAGIQAPFSDRSFSEIFEEEKGKFPANLATTANRAEAAGAAFRGEFGQRPVDVEGVENPVPLFKDRIGSRFDEELARINERQGAIQEEFPNATSIGDLSGDALALMMGRLPFAKGINAVETAITAKKFSESMTNPGTRKLVEKALDTGSMRRLMRGAGRAAETGIEAAVLSTLNDGDPLETAGIATGAQMVGSAILQGIKGVGKHPILASAFGFAALIQMGKETIPGGRDSFIDSLESGFEKVWWGLIAGATATIAGGGRIRGNALSENWPRVADLLSTMTRAQSISLLNGYLTATPDEQQTIDATLDKLQRDPGFFGTEIEARLLKALEDGNFAAALREEL